MRPRRVTGEGQVEIYGSDEEAEAGLREGSRDAVGFMGRQAVPLRQRERASASASNPFP
jgi:hypothetical protein